MENGKGTIPPNTETEYHLTVPTGESRQPRAVKAWDYQADEQTFWTIRLRDGTVTEHRGCLLPPTKRDNEGDGNTVYRYISTENGIVYNNRYEFQGCLAYGTREEMLAALENWASKRRRDVAHAYAVIADQVKNGGKILERKG